MMQCCIDCILPESWRLLSRRNFNERSDLLQTSKWIQCFNGSMPSACIKPLQTSLALIRIYFLKYVSSSSSPATQEWTFVYETHYNFSSLLFFLEGDFRLNSLDSAPAMAHSNEAGASSWETPWTTSFRVILEVGSLTFGSALERLWQQSGSIERFHQVHQKNALGMPSWKWQGPNHHPKCSCLDQILLRRMESCFQARQSSKGISWDRKQSSESVKLLPGLFWPFSSDESTNQSYCRPWINGTRVGGRRLENWDCWTYLIGRIFLHCSGEACGQRNLFSYGTWLLVSFATSHFSYFRQSLKMICPTLLHPPE